MYIPLYDAPWLPPAQYCVRPLELFFENVEYDGKIVPRFVKIIDEEIIAILMTSKSDS